MTRIYVSLFWAIISVFLSNLAWADANAEHNAQKIFNQLSTTTLMRAKFSQQKQLAGTNRTFLSSGTVVFAKQSGVLWRLSAPVQADLIMTPRFMVQKTANTQSKISLEQNQYAPIASVFLQLMAGNGTTLRQHFVINSASHSPQAWQIDLSPKSATMKKLFNNLKVVGKKDIETLVITDKNKALTTIKFNAHQHAGTLTEQENALFKLAN